LPSRSARRAKDRKTASAAESASLNPDTSTNPETGNGKFSLSLSTPVLLSIVNVPLQRQQAPST
jgi:hypothetical protein